MGLIIALVILLQTIFPGLSVSPSSTANLVSFQFDQVNGYGVQARIDRFSLEYYNLTLSTRDPGELIDVGGEWVYQKELELWEINALVLEEKIVDIGIGINRIESGQIGWQVFVEKNFSGIVMARIGYHRFEIHKQIDSISATFGIDIFEAIRIRKIDYLEREVEGSTR